MSTNTDTVITVDRVAKSFGPLRVLDGVSLSVQRGETLAVLGRSGTGKSVLLKSIIGLLDPDRGRIEVLGRCFAEMSEQERLRHRKNMGYVFQGAALFDSLTVCENVGFSLSQARVPDSEIRRRVQQRLAMVGLDHAIDKYPSELSGGMQKRVGLARALIEDPEIILYDEPTSGLDPLTTDVINQIILRLRNRLAVTSVVVTHDIGSAFTIADRVVILDGGHILAQGSPTEIEQSELPWVQHFIRGQALENELLESGGTRVRTRSQSGSTSSRFSPPSPALEPLAGSASSKLTAIRRQKRREHDHRNSSAPPS
ncbi:MAG: ABC transporter ATP-binding protein [Planctomycetota bacterium]|nr:MAG: ABC transporter ATP-binding protein [Planctomycetota bacterium]